MRRTLTCSVLMVMFFANATGVLAQDESEQIPEVFQTGAETVRFGLCVYQSVLPHCPTLSSESEDCDAWSEFSDQDLQAIQSACHRLSRLPRLRGQEVRLEMRAALDRQGRFMYRVRLTTGHSTSSRLLTETTDRQLARALRSASRAAARAN